MELGDTGSAVGGVVAVGGIATAIYCYAGGDSEKEAKKKRKRKRRKKKKAAEKAAAAKGQAGSAPAASSAPKAKAGSRRSPKASSRGGSPAPAAQGRGGASPPAAGKGDAGHRPASPLASPWNASPSPGAAAYDVPPGEQSPALPYIQDFGARQGLPASSARSARSAGRSESARSPPRPGSPSPAHDGGWGSPTEGSPSSRGASQSPERSRASTPQRPQPEPEPEPRRSDSDDSDNDEEEGIPPEAVMARAPSDARGNPAPAMREVENLQLRLHAAVGNAPADGSRLAASILADEQPSADADDWVMVDTSQGPEERWETAQEAPAAAPESRLARAARAIFERFDADRDGYHNLKESRAFAQALKEPPMSADDFRDMCEDLGADRTRGIDLGQLVAIYDDPKSGVRPHIPARAFLHRRFGGVIWAIVNSVVCAGGHR